MPMLEQHIGSINLKSMKLSEKNNDISYFDEGLDIYANVAKC